MFGWERSRARPNRGATSNQKERTLCIASAPSSSFSSRSIGLAGLASAQAQDTPRQRLDAVRAALVEIDAAFKNPSLSDSDLQRLRADNDPLASRSPERHRRIGAQARSLGQTPRRTDAQIEGQGARSRRRHRPNSPPSKRSTTISTPICAARARSPCRSTTITRASARRGARSFARQTFERSSSILSPLLWVTRHPRGACRPRDARRPALRLAERRLRAGSRACRRSACSAWRSLLACSPRRSAGWRGASSRATRRSPRRASCAARFAAIWTALVLAGIPLLGLLAVAYALDAFDLSDPRLQGVAGRRCSTA